jgi:hypothetical protein
MRMRATVVAEPLATTRGPLGSEHVHPCADVLFWGLSVRPRTGQPFWLPDT